MQEDIESLRGLINLGQTPKRITEDGTPLLVLRSDEKTEDVERFLIRPVRKRAKPQFFAVACFCDYVNQQKLPETRIYIPNSTTFTAVINGHGTDPGWGDHTATLALKLTPEWKTWTEKNTKPCNQRDFASFIEDNLDDIATPPGAEMLDLVRVFQATQSAEFKSVATDKPGNNRLEYVQTAATRAGTKGDVELPDSFTVRLSVYEGGESADITARLRYSVNDGKLSLWFELFRVQKFIDAAVMAIAAIISQSTEIPVWSGQP